MYGLVQIGHFLGKSNCVSSPFFDLLALGCPAGLLQGQQEIRLPAAFCQNCPVVRICPKRRKDSRNPAKTLKGMLADLQMMARHL